MRYTAFIPLSVFLTIAGAIIGASPSPGFAAAGMPSANARVCGLMPMQELTRLMGSPPTSITGIDAAAMSTCTALFGQFRVARVQHGVPADIGMALAAYRAQGMQVRQYGDVACVGGREPIGQNNWQSFCINPKGYTALTLTRGGSMVPFDVVRKLLAAAQAKI